MISKGIIFVALICLYIGVGLACEKATPLTGRSNPQAAICTINVSVDDQSRDVYFAEVKKFADKHAFAFRLGQSSPDPADIILQMWREDIKVVGVNTSPGKYAVYFYENSPNPVLAAQLDSLVDDFKNYVSNVAIVTLKERSHDPKRKSGS